MYAFVTIMKMFFYPIILFYVAVVRLIQLAWQRWRRS